VLEFQANDVRDIHKFSSLYGLMPNRCDNCNSENIYLSYKNPKGNDYYTIACRDCGAELSLHQKKEGGFYLVAGEKMAIYSPNQPQMNQQPNYGNSLDNVPF
jgi:DNA-directed RNA polymerase subunit RPC12/RpoP